MHTFQSPLTLKRIAVVEMRWNAVSNCPCFPCHLAITYLHPYYTEAYALATQINLLQEWILKKRQKAKPEQICFYCCCYSLPAFCRQHMATHEKHELSCFSKSIVLLQRFNTTNWAKNVKNEQSESECINTEQQQQQQHHRVGFDKSQISSRHEFVVIVLDNNGCHSAVMAEPYKPYCVWVCVYVLKK